MTPQQLFFQLRTRPDYILTYYQLTIAGGPNDAWTQFSFTPTLGRSNPRPGRVLGFMTHQAQAFNVMHSPLGGPANVFPAYNVRMQAGGTYAVAGIIGTLLPDIGPPALLLTGQLSGCSFCCLPVAGGVVMAHLQPPPGAGAGIAPQANVLANGRFVGHPAAPIVNVYGKNNYPNGRASVVGVRNNNQWELYGQEYNNMTKQILSMTQFL